MTDHLRTLSVHVEEDGPGRFHWVILESTEDATVWGEGEASFDTFARWDEALAAGVAALRAYAKDQAAGPRAEGEDEDPVG